ncbi:YdcF family protein [Sorangium sp. So ce887]|uniref:YdcF family protein n=1 Tax=Sorangium sp. So ce887 TaxID=3133324 RepID=UPI003F5FCBC4
MPLHADAIVVLGCRMLPSGRPAAPGARRAARAAQAYRDGVAPWVIASGGRRWGAQIEARVLSAELRRAGVPAHAILQDLWSLTTHENAIFSAALLRRMGARRAAIVTCPWHMTRALQNFREVGIDACALPAPHVSASVVARAWQRGHEVVSMWLDARAMRRRRILCESAAWLLDSARRGET